MAFRDNVDATLHSFDVVPSYDDEIESAVEARDRLKAATGRAPSAREVAMFILGARSTKAADAASSSNNPMLSFE